MCTSKLFVGYVVLIVNIAVMFFLEHRGGTGFGELVFIFLSIMFAFSILKGLRKSAVWSWPSMIIFLILAVANFVYLFVVTKNATGLIMMVMNLFGIVLIIIWSLEEDNISNEDREVQPKMYNAIMPKEHLKTQPRKRSAYPGL